MALKVPTRTPETVRVQNNVCKKQIPPDDLTQEEMRCGYGFITTDPESLAKYNDAVYKYEQDRLPEK